MGKIPCSSCNKTCKGQTIKLQDKYFHIKCFKCKECQKLLAAGSFYTKDNFQYCVDDYQKLFCMTCKVCGEFIHGEIVKAYDNAYHDGCFLCSKCRRKFEAGDKVTNSGGDYLCNNCLDGDDMPRKEVSIGRTPGKVNQDDVATLTPFSKLSASAPTTPAHQERPIDGCITSGSDMDYLSDVKESTKNAITPTRTSTLNTSGYKSDTSYDYGEPGVSRNDHLSDVFDDSDTQDPEKRQAFLPIQNSMKYRTASPGELSQSSRKSKESLSRFDANYGKFYKTSYLDMKDSFKRGPSINLRDQSPKHYHRPDNFSYSKVQNFLKPSKRGLLSSMAKENRLQESPRGIVYKPDKSEEPIILSKLPQGMQNRRVAPIERDDWPAPPDPAAAYPELLRDKRFKRKSMPDGLNDFDGDEIDHASSTRIIKVDKEIEELSKLPNSGAAKVLLDDLKRAKVREPRPLDPRSSSRTPSAALEPPYKTRYESPIFASPSRDLDQRLRLRSLDCLTERKFRTQSQISNYPGQTRGYETPKDVVKSREVVRPGYSLSGRSSAVDSRGRISQLEMYMPRRPDSSAAVLQSNSYYSSQNSIDEYDSTTGLKKNVRHRCTTPAEEWLSYSGIRRSVPNLFRMEEPPKIYPYEKLKSFKGEYPPAVNSNTIEAHLSKEEFESLFLMDHEEFYRLPEWKRNDLKSRVGLF